MPPTYESKIQYVEEDLTKPLTPSQIKAVKQIAGEFLYYPREFDNKLAQMTNHIGS